MQALQSYSATPGSHCDPNENNAVLSYHFASAVWGVTAGVIINQSMLQNASWSTRVFPVFVPINWMVFPSKVSCDCRNNNHRIIDRVRNLALAESSKIIGLSAGILIPLFIEYPLTSTEQAIVSICLVALNIFACYRLRKIAPPANRVNILSAARQAIQWMSNAGNHLPSFFSTDRASHHPDNQHNSDREELINSLEMQIDALKEENRKVEQQIEAMKKFIENDPILKQGFINAYQQSQSILLPPQKKDSATPAENPLVEEWRQEMHKKHCLEKAKTRIRDFLDKNPDYQDQLKESFYQSTSSSIVSGAGPLRAIEDSHDSNKRDS